MTAEKTLPVRIADEILTAGDRGDQEVHLAQALGWERRASKRQLYENKVRAAEISGAREFATRITDVIKEDPAAEAASSLTEQLSDLPLHSFVLPADSTSLEGISKSVRRVKDITNYSDTASAILAESLIRTIQFMANRGEETPGEIVSKTSKAIRSIRNLSIIDDAILGQLMLRSQTGVKIGFDGLGQIFEQTSYTIINEAYQMNMSGKLVTQIVEPVKNHLHFASQFISLAKDARVSLHVQETEEEAYTRGVYFAEVAAILANDRVHSHEKFNESEMADTAQILVESFFAHRIHWTPKTPDIVGTLYANLVLLGNKPLADSMLLHAQQSGLLGDDLSNIVLENAQLPVEKFRENCRIIKHQTQVDFEQDPKEIVKGKKRVGLLLGFMNIPHIGHRNLTFGGARALGGTDVIVSINQRDPRRTAIRSQIKEIDFRNRRKLAATNLAGILGGKIHLSSIDLVTNPDLPPTERIETFLNKYYLDGSRICGMDRLNLSPKSVSQIIIGLRGYDLQTILEDPDHAENIRATFPASDITLLAMQGTTSASSTSVYHIAREVAASFHRGNPNGEKFNQLRALTHPKNLIKILSLVE